MCTCVCQSVCLSAELCHAPPAVAESGKRTVIVVYVRCCILLQLGKILNGFMKKEK